MALSTDVDPTAFLGSTVTTIVIITDDGEKNYVAHKDVLCDESAYFATAYRTSMKEAADDRFEIKDVLDAAMRSLITWLYTGKVYLEPGVAPPLEAPAVESSGAEGSRESSTGPQENATARDNDDRFDDGSDHDGSYSDSSPTDSDDYNAMYDGMDFEYEEEPEDESEDESEDEEEPSSEKEAQDIARASSWCFSGHKNASEFDAYQLSVLVRLCEQWPKEWSEEEWPFLESWKQRLEDVLETEIAPGSAEVDVYDRLIDLYILGDRFDMQDFRIKIMNLVIAYRNDQRDTIGKPTVPSIQSVVKACENLPSACPLRVWLVHGFAWDWYAVIDGAEQLKLYEDLPKDFLLEVLAVMSQKSRWGWTVFPVYQDLCVCHRYDFEDEEKRREMKGETHPVNSDGKKLRQ